MQVTCDERLKGLPRLLRYALLSTDGSQHVLERLIAEIHELCPNLPLSTAWAIGRTLEAGLALAAGGMLQGRPITLHQNRLTGPDGTLVGAHLTMIEEVRNVVAMVGISLVDASFTASRTPAAFLRLGAKPGRTARGYARTLLRSIQSLKF